jgi:DinB superfamily
MTETTHDDRIADLLGRLRETSTRVTERLTSAGAQAEQATTGWTPAQVVFHVAMVNENLASVIDGTLAAATPPASDFRERVWADVVRDVPARNEAPARFQPPATVTSAEALERFQHSVSHLASAVETLTPERARYCITNRVVGTITLYQTGDFAIAHMIRHNQQLKRILQG